MKLLLHYRVLSQYIGMNMWPTSNHLQSSARTLSMHETQMQSGNECKTEEMQGFTLPL